MSCAIAVIEKSKIASDSMTSSNDRPRRELRA
jgi:hypothetical protein